MKFKSLATIEKFKVEVINSTLLVCCVLATVILLISTPRFTFTVKGLDYMSDLAGAFVLILTWAFRHKLSLHIKSAILFLLIYKIVITDALSYGIFSEDKVFLVLLPFYGMLVYNFRKTVFMYLVGVVAFLFVGYLHISGLVEAVPDNNTRITSVASWIMAILIVTVVAAIIGMFTRKYFKNIHLLLLELESKNLSLEEHQSNMEDTILQRTQKVSQMNKELTAQRNELKSQKEIIEKQLNELNTIKNNLEEAVSLKTKELQQANKELVAQNAQLEQYAYITAHNLRAPVARMKGLAHLYELQKNVTSDHNELFGKIQEAAADMNEVLTDINKILEIKNFNQQDRLEVSIGELITKIIKRLEDRVSRLEVKIVQNLEISVIKSIEPYIESILYNLIHNGIKYSRDEVDSFVEIHTYSDKKNVIIEVKDNGVGIDLEKHKDKIFGLYNRFHDHVNGKGMGLYLVKTQVEALNGKISVKSIVNSGTTFFVTLPL